MENLEIYNKVRSVPKEALKTITGSRLNGMSDINPMWRIKTLTETFGLCGIGWKTEIVRTWLDNGSEGIVSANVEILLKVKVGEAWSDGIPGIGGSMFVAKEKNGLYTSDECYKMAYTDAISVACKALGIGADVYWDKDSTKYTNSNVPDAPITYESSLDYVLTFGKYSGKTMKEVYKTDRDYIRWLSNSDKTDANIKKMISLIDTEILNLKIKEAEERNK